MKFYMIHLMPFADLDLSYDKHYNSAWVTLPNTYYDPQKGAKLYNRYIDELVLADELGFDGVCCNEHHQNAYGLMPIPGVIAGALVRETKRCHVAVLGRALPLLTYPLSVAEEYAMLDNISNGRLIAGFVRGIGAEYHSTGVNPAESHDRFHEAHDLILQAWTRPGPFAFEGKYYHFQYVNTWPRPVQQPHPPIWIPSQGSRETIEWASHPSRKYTYLQTFSPVDQLARFMAMYQQQAEKYGYQASPQQLGWATPVYVSDSDEAARREARPHIEAFYNKFLQDAGRDAVAARLPVARLDGVGDRQDPRRAGRGQLYDRGLVCKRHDHLRRTRLGRPATRDLSKEGGFRKTHRNDAIRHAAARPDCQEHAAVRARGDAAAASHR